MNNVENNETPPVGADDVSDDASVGDASSAATKLDKDIKDSIAYVKKNYNRTLMQNEKLSIRIMENTLAAKNISVRFNVLANELEIIGIPSEYSKESAANTLPVFLEDWLRSQKVKDVTIERIHRILSNIADKNRFNPIQDWLDSGAWDGTHRIPVLFEILNVTEEKYKMYIRKWLVQCIALILNDGDNPISAEGVLVLQGAQGLAKTSFFRKLVPLIRYFIEGASIDVANKDSLLNATSGWICELGELDSTLRREQSALKAFITAPSDKIRRPYAKTATRTPRRTSFCGTVNPEDYLRDETGSRRFWTVPITYIDKTRLFSLTDDFVKQLWLEVYELYKKDPNGFRLTDVEMKQLQADNNQFTVPLPFEIEVREMFNLHQHQPSWRWYKASDVVAKMNTHASAVQIGKVLNKIITEELESNRWTAPYAHGCGPGTRTYQGSQQYCLPIV